MYKVKLLMKTLYFYRILGRQLMLPQDTGYHVIHTDSSRPSTGSMGITDITDHDISATPDFQGYA